ncbi:DEAD/DEAH box helicase [Phycicoccus endophyticus]|uniref:DEAD/DEAH box helicase n=1 Tax=Phycicoccus endophyticus TaxID=1690220 RepID=A0A7G9R617_9MICO|nr:DEAD/DEAH box helicase [Phycicoccus endophyticus]NHI20060.1 DEAD/DEAH box helicase [Phycicoccus endophyticus]QNN51042.1 DEAD/DEAH box helicase [Phycicoccus endophyticus]
MHLEVLAARPPRLAQWPEGVAPAVLAALLGAGVERPWSHQREAIDLASAGTHVVLSTGTASGKSLGYLVPVLASLAERPASGLSGPSALYLSPTKALAADQLARVDRLAVPGVRAATYDGDTPPEERRWVREHANLVLTNPDLLHHSLLPGHERWSRFLRGLRYVVVDECHVYRGVFGSHVAAVLRRLRRVAARYGASPTFVLASATVSDPAEHAARLTGLPVRAVTDDGSPRGAMTFALWEPAADEEGARRSATTEAAALMADLVGHGVQTVAFARSRAGAEALASGARRRLAAEHPQAVESVAAYRGGYLPQDRRELEAGLRAGSLRGLAATNALELGVDVSGLDAVVMAGWPGRRASLWQQAGRAGRSGGESLAVLVAADDPLDGYLVRHPEALFGAPVESTVLDPENPQVLAPHLAAAAAELPLVEDDLGLFGEGSRRLLDVLVESGILRRRPAGWFWARQDRPAAHISLRGASEVVAVVERRTGRVVGTVDEAAAHSQVHTGAVHVHQGEAWVVTELDLEARVAHVVRGDPGWSTQAESVSRFDILATERSAQRARVVTSFGTVRVTSRVTGFTRRLPGGEVVGRHALDLPERTLTTKAVWWTVEPEVLTAAGVEEAAVPGALHGAEHAAIGMLPLVATSDRWDVGGVSTARHPDTGLPTVMVFDGYPGGAGFAERASERFQAWVRATRDAVLACPCADGCPACVQSPKCGNGNDPLDKAGAVAVLDLAVAGAG